MTEPGAGSDVANIRTTAVKKGNDVSNDEESDNCSVQLFV